MSAKWKPFLSNQRSDRASSDARAQGPKTALESHNTPGRMDAGIPPGHGTRASLRGGEGEGNGAPAAQPNGLYSSPRRDNELFRPTSDESGLALDVWQMAQLEREVARKRNEVADLQGQLREATAQRRRDAEKIATLDSELCAAREDTRGWKCRAEAATGQLQDSKSSHRDMKRLLELRTSELIHTQTFLSKVDNVSHAEVLSMVENLNDLGFQLASHIIDNSTFSAIRRPYPPETKASVEEVLGKAMTETLISEYHDEDPVLVQVALRAAIAAVSFVLIQRWDYALWPAQDNLLSGIQEKLFTFEPQGVSARWRALVRRYIREINHDENVDHVSKASADLLNVLKNTLEVSRGTIQGEQRVLLEKSREVVEQCLQFQQIIGEDVASTLFELLYPFYGTTFTPKYMEDIDDGARGKMKGLAGNVEILCTVDLGLKRRDKVETSNGAEMVREFVLLKAKTMLSLGSP